MTIDDLRREYFENRLGRAVGGRFAKERKELMGLLGDPPDLNNVPDTFWTNNYNATSHELYFIIADIAAESGLLLQEQTVGAMVIDWAMVNQNAATWARQYTYGLVTGINDTSRTWLQKTIPAFREEAWTRAQLEAELRKIYSPVHASMIAVTETTRAAVEGDRLVVDRIREDTGMQMKPIWRTSEDELVCPICGPRANKEITDGMFPPAHPRCRCNVSWEIIP